MDGEGGSVSVLASYQATPLLPASHPPTRWWPDLGTYQKTLQKYCWLSGVPLHDQACQRDASRWPDSAPMAPGRRWMGTESLRKSISMPNTFLNTTTTHTYTNTVCPEEPPVRRVLPPTLGHRVPEANSCRIPGCPHTRQPGRWSECSLKQDQILLLWHILTTYQVVLLSPHFYLSSLLPYGGSFRFNNSFNSLVSIS